MVSISSIPWADNSREVLRRQFSRTGIVGARRLHLTGAPIPISPMLTRNPGHTRFLQGAAAQIPMRATKVPEWLEKFPGKEVQLLGDLERKYGGAE